MSKEPEREESYSKPISKKPKIKKFNLKEEKITNGWEKTKASGYDVREFGWTESIFVSLVAVVVILLGQAKGFLNFDFLPLIDGSVPGWVAAVSIFLLSETIFYFMFLFGRIKKLSFIKETVPYKAISYVLGIVATIITPITTIIGGALIPFCLNHVFGNYMIRKNFDKRAKYYAPEEFEEPTYEEPKEKPKKTASPKEPQTFISANISDYKLVEIPDSEYKTAYGGTYDVDNVDIGLPKISGNILDKLGF